MRKIRSEGVNRCDHKSERSIKVHSVCNRRLRYGGWGKSFQLGTAGMLMQLFIKEISIVKLLLLTGFVCALFAGKPWKELYQAGPLEQELVREGPLDVETIRGRNAAVRFIRKDGDGRGFLFASYAFNQSVSIFSLIQEQRKKGVVHAYLWTHYPQGGEVTVWRIDINDINVLSYERAEKNLKNEIWLYKLNRVAACVFAISLSLSFIQWGSLIHGRRYRGR